MPSSDQLRQDYLDYFRDKGHMVIPSASLIPAGDPTLLLTSAGMVPFKPYFLGQASPPARRLTSSQKSFRTTDIDLVGDHKHLTLFEMLGNFSIGDYSKQEAIAYAWEFITRNMKIKPGRLWVTVYLEDDEAAELWKTETSIPEGHIYRYGHSDNWWGPPGAEGPCGPCSEIHYDFGEEYGCGEIGSPDQAHLYEVQEIGCHPNCDRCERFLELWNLVFTQFYQDREKNLSPLPAPNIDTGMGLERAATISQGQHTVYETDLFAPLLSHIGQLCDKTYGENRQYDRAMRVVVEHGRAAAFLIADGVIPSNDGRGYVLRRVIRRAVRFGRQLGLKGAFLGKVAEAVAERMGPTYPELLTNRLFILRVLELEEERYEGVFERGLEILKGMIDHRVRYSATIPEILTSVKTRSPVAESTDVVLERHGLISYDSDSPSDQQIGQGIATDVIRRLTTEASQAIPNSEVDPGTDEKLDALANWARSISAEEIFTLYDTYGFPPQEVQEIAREYELSLDMDGFELEMESQREKGRSGPNRFAGESHAKIFEYSRLGIGATRFLGYENLEAVSVVVGLIVDGSSATTAAQDQEVEVVLRETPFYSEGGGQVGDMGELIGPSGRVAVEDTQSPISGLIVHRGRLTGGKLAIGDMVQALVDTDRRMNTARNHTATHMLHAALRQVLGLHVRQAGSLVTPDRLRFDFTHVQAVTPEELEAVERMVNEKIRQDIPISRRESTYSQAVQEGALAFFGDKYGETVRVVEMGDCPRSPEATEDGHEQTPKVCFSSEVCGGTHLERTGEIGLCLVTGESAVASGMRRLEAVTGHTAEAIVRQQTDAIRQVSHSLGARPDELLERAQSLLEDLDRERHRTANLERQLAHRDAEKLLGESREVNGQTLLVTRVEATSIDAIREVGDYLKEKLGSGVVALGSVINDRPTLVVMVTSDLVRKGVDAVRIVRQAAEVIGGDGGGKPESAQAGGRYIERLDEALRLVPDLLGSQED
jgi:alanyl-tRNA synthetase